MSTALPAIQVDAVSKSFAGLRALTDVSFEIRTGMICGIIGPNGAGKTTLFNVVSGAILPDTGTIRFSGREVTRLPLHARARLGVARTFQTPKIFDSLTCFENVLVGAYLHTSGDGPAREAAERALRLIGIEPPWDFPASELNLETRRMVEMARLIATGAQVILLDEPMAGLNPSEIQRTADAIRALRKERGMTFIVIEHHISILMSLSDHLMALHFGRKIAEGPPKAVSDNPTVREVYLGISGGSIGPASG